MRKGGVRRAGASVWRERVEQQAASGLAVGEFCRREGLSVWSFYHWRLRLRAENEGAKPAAKRTALVRRDPMERTGGFIDLGALSSASSGWEVRLDLGGGIVLHLARR
ncbi:MAG: IS66 family insertion sequence element accessory protein TnpA [Steroidobacteraceae bacterium]